MKIEIDIKELELQTITLNVDNTLEYCKIDIRTLKRNIKQMTETSISFVDKKEDITEYINILPYAKINKNNIKVFYPALTSTSANEYSPPAQYALGSTYSSFITKHYNNSKEMLNKSKNVIASVAKQSN